MGPGLARSPLRGGKRQFVRYAPIMPLTKSGHAWVRVNLTSIATRPVAVSEDHHPLGLVSFNSDAGKIVDPATTVFVCFTKVRREKIRYSGRKYARSQGIRKPCDDSVYCGLAD